MDRIEDNLEKLDGIKNRLGRLQAQQRVKNSAEVQAKIENERKEAKILCDSIFREIKSAGSNGESKQQLQKYTKRLQEQMQVLMPSGGGAETAPLANSRANEDQPLMKMSGNSRSYGISDDADVQIDMFQIDHESSQKRTTEIQQIERDMTDVAMMFKDLKELVDEQQEDLDTIHKNIEGTLEKTKDSNTQLLKAEEYQTKARKKQCCILFIMLTALVVISLIIWVATKPSNN